MDSKLLLIKVMTLLYKEALFKEPQDRSISLAKEIIGMVRLPEGGTEANEFRDRLHELKKTALWMTTTEDSGPFDRNGLLQRIRVASGADDTLFQAFEIGMEDPYRVDEEGKKGIDPVATAVQCQNIRSEIYDHRRQARFKELAKQAYYKANVDSEESYDIGETMREMARQLEEVANIGNSTRVKGMVDEVYFEDEEDSVRVLKQTKMALSIEGALKFGQQALNDACHDHGAALRGEQWLISALSHNYKSGFGLTCFADFALFNKPMMLDPTKKPLLMHITTENELTQNVAALSTMLKERETGKPYLAGDMNPVEDAKYIKERLGVKGYHTYMSRVDPSETSVFEIFELAERLEAQGYEIHGIFIDYPAMLDKRGLTMTTAGSELRDILRRIRNFFTKRKTFQMVFHQLGPAAVQLYRMGTPDLVKEVAGKNMYDGCSKLFQEVDVDVTIHIERMKDGTAWLSYQFAKHRKLKRTPAEKWYGAIPMNDIGGLIPDINKEAHYVRDLSPYRQGGSGDWLQSLL